MDFKKFIIVALVGSGLYTFGRIVYVNQKSAQLPKGHGPISVAAVRGGTIGKPIQGLPASQVMIESAEAMREDVAISRKTTQKYNSAVHQSEVINTVTSENE